MLSNEEGAAIISISLDKEITKLFARSIGKKCAQFPIATKYCEPPKEYNGHTRGPWTNQIIITALEGTFTSDPRSKNSCNLDPRSRLP